MAARAIPYSPEDLYTKRGSVFIAGTNYPKSPFPWEELELDVFV